MIAVQSLWTGTHAWKLTRDALLLHTLTLCCIRRHFPFVELVTDEAGVLIADRLRWPYDSFRLDLQFIPERIRHIWAAGKLVAQRVQEEPYVHIDNDFVLFDPLPDRIRRAPVFVQGKDEPSYYLNPEHLGIFDVAGIPRGSASYNAGIIGGSDLRTLHGYCDYSLGLMDRVAHLPNGTVLAIITEQAGFGHYCRQNRVTPVEMIPYPVSSQELDFRDCRFTHLWADSKRRAQWIQRVEDRMKKDFPEEYAVFNEGFPLIPETLNHPRRWHLYSYGIANGA